MVQNYVLITFDFLCLCLYHNLNLYSILSGISSFSCDNHCRKAKPPLRGKKKKKQITMQYAKIALWKLFNAIFLDGDQNMFWMFMKEKKKSKTM